MVWPMRMTLLGNAGWACANAARRFMQAWVVTTSFGGAQGAARDGRPYAEW